MKRRRLRGFEARVFQHELDHLRGVLHIDRQLPPDRSKIQPFLDKLVELHGPGGVLELPPDVLAGLQPPPGSAELPVGSAPPQRRGPPVEAAPAVAASSASGGGTGPVGFGGGGSKSSGKKGGKKGDKKKR